MVKLILSERQRKNWNILYLLTIFFPLVITDKAFTCKIIKAPCTDGSWQKHKSFISTTNSNSQSENCLISRYIFWTGNITCTCCKVEKKKHKHFFFVMNLCIQLWNIMCNNYMHIHFFTMKRHSVLERVIIQQQIIKKN